MDVTGLIIERLAEAATRSAVGAGLGGRRRPGGGRGERVTLRGLNDLRELLDARVRGDGELKGLREHPAQWAAQAAPREVSDVKGMVEWSLGRVDWRAVHAFLGTEAGIAAQREAREAAGDKQAISTAP